MVAVQPRILVLASGDKHGGGGSGFQEMVEYTRTMPLILNANIVGVGLSRLAGGVQKKAEMLGVEFMPFLGPYTAEQYQRVVQHFRADYVMCSGWLKQVMGLDPAIAVNIHPGLFPLTRGLYGDAVHVATMVAYHKGEITQSAVTMHFMDDVDGEYDTGSRICEFPVLIRKDDTSETLAKRVNEVERVMQSRVLNLIVHRHIWLLNGHVVRYDRYAEDALFAMGGKVLAGPVRPTK